MSGFEFAFSLFGLVLGLSVTEVIAGLARAVRDRARVRMGLLTPLLGLLLLFDLVTFWSGTWVMRDQFPVNFLTLSFGTLCAAVYYLSASLLFPSGAEAVADLDDHYFRNRRLILAGPMCVTVLANLIALWLLLPWSLWPHVAVTTAVSVFVFGGLMLLRSRAASTALLVAGIISFFIPIGALILGRP